MAAKRSKENMFILGMPVKEAKACENRSDNAEDFINKSTALKKQTVEQLEGGMYAKEQPDCLCDLAILSIASFCADFSSYIACQDRISEIYRNKQTWSHVALINIASTGRFSTDRMISETPDLGRQRFRQLSAPVREAPAREKQP